MMVCILLHFLFVLPFWLSQNTYSNIFSCLVTGASNLSEESTTHTNTSECNANKTPNKSIIYLLYPIFGLTAVSLIIYMVYLYTRSLERRLVKTNTVLQIIFIKHSYLNLKTKTVILPHYFKYKLQFLWFF